MLSRLPARLALLLTLLLACVPAAAARPISNAAQSAYWIKIKLPLSFNVGVASSDGGCAIIPYFDLPQRKGLESYSLQYWDSYFNDYTYKNYPPFPSMEVPALAAPKGIIRQSAAGAFGGGACDPSDPMIAAYRSRFNVPGHPNEAYGYIKRNNRFLLAGHVKDEMLKPVSGAKVRITGPGSKTLTTDSDGYYFAVLPKGKYRVAAGKDYRPVKSRDCKPLKKEKACQIKLSQDRTADFEQDAPALVYSARLSGYVRGNQVRQAVQAGYPFAITVTLRNTSREHRLVIGPMAVEEAEGNLADGSVRLEGKPRGRISVTGALSEVRPSPLLVLEPKQTRSVDVVFTTSMEGTLLPGGLRAAVRFRPPDFARVKDDVDKGAAQLTADDLQPLDPKKDVLVKPDSLSFALGVDPSDVKIPIGPYSNGVAFAYFTQGMLEEGWRATSGFAASAVALPGKAKQAYLWTMGRPVYLRDMTLQLWDAIRESPDLQADLGRLTYQAWEQAYQEVPAVFNKALATPAAVQAALQQHFEPMHQAWIEGRWDNAMRAGGRDVVLGGELAGELALTTYGPGLVAKAARVMGAGVMLRLEKVREVLAAQQLRLGLAIETRLAPYLSEGISPLAVRGLLTSLYTRPALGSALSPAQLRVLFGLSDEAIAQLRALAVRGAGLVITLRARSEEALLLIEAGLAVAKPYFIKAKTIGYLDWKFLGYPKKLAGAVALRAPEQWAVIERRLAGLPQGLRNMVRERWVQRRDEYVELMGRYRQWAKEGRVPDSVDLTGFTENLIDPTLAPKTLGAPTRFRLTRKTYRSGPVDVIELSDDGSRWRMVAGDSDLSAVTHVDSRPLSDSQRIKVISELAEGPAGAMHPDSGSWAASAKLRNRYIGNNGKDVLAQIGPDGAFRAVQHVPGLSRYENPANYYQHFQGGYYAPAGTSGALGPRNLLWSVQLARPPTASADITAR